jgi:hypothetical protein
LIPPTEPRVSDQSFEEGNASANLAVDFPRAILFPLQRERPEDHRRQVEILPDRQRLLEPRLSIGSLHRGEVDQCARHQVAVSDPSELLGRARQMLRRLFEVLLEDRHAAELEIVSRRELRRVRRRTPLARIHEQRARSLRVPQQHLDHAEAADRDRLRTLRAGLGAERAMAPAEFARFLQPPLVDERDAQIAGGRRLVAHRADALTERDRFAQVLLRLRPMAQLGVHQAQVRVRNPFPQFRFHGERALPATLVHGARLLVPAQVPQDLSDVPGHAALQVAVARFLRDAQRLGMGRQRLLAATHARQRTSSGGSTPALECAIAAERSQLDRPLERLEALGLAAAGLVPRSEREPGGRAQRRVAVLLRPLHQLGERVALLDPAPEQILQPLFANQQAEPLALVEFADLQRLLDQCEPRLGEVAGLEVLQRGCDVRPRAARFDAGQVVARQELGLHAPGLAFDLARVRVGRSRVVLRAQSLRQLAVHNLLHEVVIEPVVPARGAHDAAAALEFRKALQHADNRLAQDAGEQLRVELRSLHRRGIEHGAVPAIEIGQPRGDQIADFRRHRDLLRAAYGRDDRQGEERVSVRLARHVGTDPFRFARVVDGGRDQLLDLLRRQSRQRDAPEPFGAHDRGELCVIHRWAGGHDQHRPTATGGAGQRLHDAPDRARRVVQILENPDRRSLAGEALQKFARGRLEDVAAPLGERLAAEQSSEDCAQTRCGAEVGIERLFESRGGEMRQDRVGEAPQSTARQERAVQDVRVVLHRGA